MGKVIGFLIVVLLVVIVLIAMAVDTVITGIRMRRWSRRSGHRWRRSTPHDHTDRRWGPPFGVGSDPRARHEITGRLRGLPLLCFAWERSVPAPDSTAEKPTTRTESFAVYSVGLGRTLPRLQVRRRDRETALHDVDGLSPAPTGDARFDGLFEVWTDNRDLARDVLTGPVRDQLLGSDLPGFRIAGSDLVVIERHGLPLKRLDEKLAVLDGLVERLPRVVVQHT